MATTYKGGYLSYLNFLSSGGSGGGVTEVTGELANGIQITVADPTTTPAISAQLKQGVIEQVFVPTGNFTEANYEVGGFINGAFIYFAGTIAEDSGIISYDNGQNWFDTNPISLGMGTEFSSVASGNGVLVVVSKDALGAMATNFADPSAINWNILNAANHILADNTLDCAIAFGEGLFVIVGDAGKAAYSYDGITTTLANTGVLDFNFNDVVYDEIHGLFIAVAATSSFSTGFSASTEDGQNWTASGALNGDYAFGELVTGNGTTVFISQFEDPTDAIEYTTDGGANWAATTLPSLQKWTGATYDPFFKIFIVMAAGEAIAAVSSDGINWTQIELDVTPQFWLKPVFGNFILMVLNSSATSSYYAFNSNQAIVDGSQGNGTVVSLDGIASAFPILAESLGTVTVNFTPTLSGWTIVNSGGDPIAIGQLKFNSGSKIAQLNIVIQSPPTTTVASTFSVSSITGLPRKADGFASGLLVTNIATGAALGNATTQQSTSTINMPTTPATGDDIIITGTYSIV